MKFEVKNDGSIKRSILVTVSPEELGTIETEVIKKIQKTATVPGFRKGHVPTGLVKKSFAETIREELLETAISKFYMQALKESALNPIDQGRISGVKFEKIDSGLEFTIEIEVEPQIVVQKSRGLKVERERPIVSDEMVEEALAEIQKKFATSKAMETSAEGHDITFSIQELGEGDVPVIGKKYDDLQVTIGSGEFDPELEKQLIGLKVDQEAVLRRHVVPGPGDAQQSPRHESYRVVVKAIAEKKLPPLDDELVKNLQEDDIKTLEELRTRLRENIQANLERRSLQQFHSRLIDEVLKENPFDVPESMVDNYLNYVIHDMKHKYPNQKLDEDLIRQRYRADAVYGVRWHLLKEEIIKVENITVSDEEIEQRIDLSPYSDDEKKQLKANKDLRRRIQGDLLEEKVLRFLEAHAEVEEIVPSEPAGSPQQVEKV